MLDRVRRQVNAPNDYALESLFDNVFAEIYSPVDLLHRSLVGLQYSATHTHPTGSEQHENVARLAVELRLAIEKLRFVLGKHRG